MDKEKFKTALRECRWLTDVDCERIEAECPNGTWRTKYPWLSRDAGSDVLKHVQDDGARLLQDEREFKNDHTFCEYHYLLDLDNDTVSMNGGKPIPFSEWTAERMKTLEHDDEEDAAYGQAK